LREFAETIASRSRHIIFPVLEGQHIIGTVSSLALTRVPANKWDEMSVADVAEHRVHEIPPDGDAMEALRLLLGERSQTALLVMDADGTLEGILTKTDLLQALQVRGETASIHG
jgi:CIC family chloride channel protein